MTTIVLYLVANWLFRVHVRKTAQMGFKLEWRLWLDAIVIVDVRQQMLQVSWDDFCFDGSGNFWESMALLTFWDTEFWIKIGGIWQKT